MLLAACGGSSGAPNTYTVTASVSGLSGSGLILQLSGGIDLAVTTDGNATFAAALTSGTNYQVTVGTQPSSPPQICSVANGSGTIRTSNVAVAVSCVVASFTVSADVSGLSGSGLVLELNMGNDLAVTSNGNASFATSVASGANYQVIVRTQPALPQQACAVANGSGTVGTGNIVVTVTCVTTSYTVGGTVQGLSGTGLVLQLNGANDTSITSNGTVSFATAVASGAPYSVEVRTQPTSPAQTCLVTRGSGTVTTYNISAVAISCITVLVGTGGPTVSTLYSFTGASTDAAAPNGSLVQGRDGNLYGTAQGGTNGTFFKIALTGHETVLDFFVPESRYDNTVPQVGVIEASDGNFYGTAAGPAESPYSGGVFGVTPTGVVSTLFEAVGLEAGAEPWLGGVIESSAGYLYAIDNYDGEIRGFAINGNTQNPAPAPNNSPLPGGRMSGAPAASLLQASDGTFYLTTEAAVYKEIAGTFTPIYSFGGVPNDASSPNVPLIQGSDGNLYGTTAFGGTPSAACPNGCGTVFRITPAGAETVLHSFGSSAADGQTPSGALVQGIDGNFYGLTSAGGDTPINASATPNCNCGTIFRITPTGAETVLYSFGTNAADGTLPGGALLQASDGNFYGTTASGGTGNAGTVFKLVLGAN